jgi:hypothetical protein
MPELSPEIAAIINDTAPQVLATPVPTQTPLPAGLATSALDWSPIPIVPFNIPIWAIFAFLSFAAVVLIYLKWNDQSADLDSIKVWYLKMAELKAGKMQVVRLTRAGNFIPDCMDIFDNILAYGDSEDNINQWRMRSAAGIIRIGGIAAALLSEDFDQNRDPPTEMAICRASRLLDENIDEFRRALTERYNDLVKSKIYDGENPAKLVRPIHSYNDYIGKASDKDAAIEGQSGHALFQWIFPGGIPIHSYTPFNQTEARKFWPAGNNTSAFLGAENLRIVEEKLVKPADKQRGFLEQWGGVMLAAMIFIGCLIAGAAIPL